MFKGQKLIKLETIYYFFKDILKWKWNFAIVSAWWSPVRKLLVQLGITALIHVKQVQFYSLLLLHYQCKCPHSGKGNSVLGGHPRGLLTTLWELLRHDDGGRDGDDVWSETKQVLWSFGVETCKKDESFMWDSKEDDRVSRGNRMYRGSEAWRAGGKNSLFTLQTAQWPPRPLHLQRSHPGTNTHLWAFNIRLVWF